MDAQGRIAAITDLSASDLAEAIRAGQYSSKEVLEAFIQRIEAVNPQLNALILPTFTEARARAAEADEAHRRGDVLGPLHGVPVTIKEQFRVKGTQITLGAANKIGNVYEAEGPLVRKLRQSGAIILGKTNVLQTLSGWETDNRVYGRTNNPWNLERSPGGSSGGESAMIAARASAMGLAADLGGSIRVPAHFCGLHGLKPTSGRLTNDDFPPELLVAGQEAVIQQPGPIARTVADVRLAMELFASTSLQPTEDLVAPVPWADPCAIQVEQLRLGMYTDNGYFPASPAVRRAVEDAAGALREQGATVVPFAPPDFSEGVRIFLGAASAGGGENFRRLLGDEKPIPLVADLLRAIWTRRSVLRLIARVSAARGQRYLADVLGSLGRRPTAEYLELVDARCRYRLRFDQSLADANLDAVLCPPFALPAVTHGTSQNLFPAAADSIVYSVLGTPAGVVSLTKVRPGEESDRPVGKDMAEITAQQVEQGSAGLPVGVQIVARHWREDIVLAVMEALEAYFDSLPDYPSEPSF